MTSFTSPPVRATPAAIFAVREASTSVPGLVFMWIGRQLPSL